MSVLPTLVAILLLAQSQPQPPLATPGELQQMYDAKEYHLCLQQIARVLRARPANAPTYDPAQLQILRGQCFIQLTDRTHAISAFAAAQTSTDPKTALTARANYLILQASPNFQYPSDTGSIDVVNPDSRNKAMLALFKTERRKIDPAVDRAKSAQSLDPIVKIVPALKDLAALELTSTGQDSEILPAFTAIGSRARELIANAVNIYDNQISQIESRANQTVTANFTGTSWWVAAGRQGLDTPDRANLEQLLANSRQAHQITQQALILSQTLKGNTDEWKSLERRAAQVVSHAQSVLDIE